MIKILLNIKLNTEYTDELDSVSQNGGAEEITEPVGSDIVNLLGPI